MFFSATGESGFEKTNWECRSAGWLAAVAEEQT